MVGLAAGLVVTVIALAAGLFQQNLSPRGAVSLLRAYGVIVAVALIGMYLAVRVIGPVAQVFVEGAASVIMLGAAFAFSLRGRVPEPGAAKNK
jgi:ABC-type sulfate transport system permease component